MGFKCFLVLNSFAALLRLVHPWNSDARHMSAVSGQMGAQTELTSKQPIAIAAVIAESVQTSILSTTLTTLIIRSMQEVSHVAQVGIPFRKTNAAFRAKEVAGLFLDGFRGALRCQFFLGIDNIIHV